MRRPPMPAFCYVVVLMVTFALLTVLCTETPAAEVETVRPPSTEQVLALFEKMPERRPRVMLNSDRLARVRGNIERDVLLAGLWEQIRDAADRMLKTEPRQREKVGRRLLGVSRDCLKRICYLAFSYHMTGNRDYLDRAEREMVAAAGFSDWNPSHFLDVAEMTAALAIGYDWLHDDLSPEGRATIRRAIVEKGLQTSFDKPGWWVNATNNWGQVCHGGLTLGALAVQDEHPELAARTIARAVDKVRRSMAAYGPNGTYPEGPGYWKYGTTYNVVLIDALQSTLGTDFNLSGHEPLMRSADFYLHAHGPTLRYFNFADGSDRAPVAEAMYWFAATLDRPELLWVERRKLAGFVDSNRGGPRLLPLMLVWAPVFDEIAPPTARHFHGEGETPIGIHRSDWDENGTYIGVKAGTPSANHGHMDIGSFVMAADGVRWAIDLGAQSYHSLESKGVGLWDGRPGGERWTVFRLNNHSHNTLVVDNELQRVRGFGTIVDDQSTGSARRTVVDMTDVYKDQLAQARRAVTLKPDASVTIDDHIQVDDQPRSVRWGMVTRADVGLDGAEAVLRQGGRTLRLRVIQPEDAQLQTFNTADPPRSYDVKNPGTRMVGFVVELDANEAKQLTVELIPGGKE